MIKSNYNTIQTNNLRIRENQNKLLKNKIKVDRTMEHFNNIKDLVKKLKKEEKRTGETYYYRGQTQNWPLSTSLLRSKDPKTEFDRTQDMVAGLLTNKTLKLDINNRLDQNKAYAIAQHYGWKTDFIDFTTDPEVAAFFATDGVSDINKVGVMWRISQVELRNIQELLTDVINYIFYSSNYSEGVKENYKTMMKYDKFPFIDIKIEELSRLNNQKGLFLWDLNHIVLRTYFKDREPDFSFRQDGNVYSSEKINKSVIYPEPNMLEMEIERYGSVENELVFNRSGLREEFEKISVPIYLHEPESIYAQFLEDNFWEKDSSYCSNEFEKTIKIIENRKLNFEDISCGDLRQIISENKELISSGKTIYLDFGDDSLNKCLNEIIKRIIYYPYSVDEIYELVISLINNYKSAKSKGIISNFEEFMSGYDSPEFQEKIFGEKMLKVGLVDSVDVQSFGYIPCIELSKIVSPIRESLNMYFKKNKDKDNINLLSQIGDWNLFLDLHRYPKRLFKFDDIKRLFIRYILPYQFISRDKNSRIYIPSNLIIFGPE